MVADFEGLTAGAIEQLVDHELGIPEGGRSPRPVRASIHIPVFCSPCAKVGECGGSRKHSKLEFCEFFTPAPAVEGPAIAVFEKKIRQLEGNIAKTGAQLRPHLLTLRDLEYLNAQGCPLSPGELETARGAVARDRAQLAELERTLLQTKSDLALRKIEAARFEAWRRICAHTPGELASLAAAREAWRSTGFVLSSASDMPNTVRLPILRRWNDAQSALHGAADYLKRLYPELATMGDPLLWDLSIPTEDGPEAA